MTQQEWINLDDSRQDLPIRSPDTNYTADKECRPTRVVFANGRIVWARQDRDGPYLEIGMEVPS